MPRRGRLHIPGGIYHVMGRGLERRSIFFEYTDKEDFLSRLEKNLPRSEMQCLAWTLMPNHYHLLIRAGERPMDKLMAPVLGGFAGRYNRRHQRSGYVFQNRYISILCDKDPYLLELVRYIHLNPLRAGIVSNVGDLARYPWTGHAGITGNHRRSWHAVDEVLALFGKHRPAAIKRYRAFVAARADTSRYGEFSRGGLIRSHGGWETLSRLRKEHRSCIGDERILGDSKFVEQALKRDQLAIQEKSRLQRQGWDLERLISRVCQVCDISNDSLFDKFLRGQQSRAKGLICYLGTEKLGLTSRRIADRLGISQPAVSKWIRKGRQFGDLADEVFRDPEG